MFHDITVTSILYDIKIEWRRDPDGVCHGDVIERLMHKSGIEGDVATITPVGGIFAWIVQEPDGNVILAGSGASLRECRVDVHRALAVYSSVSV